MTPCCFPRIFFIFKKSLDSESKTGSTRRYPPPASKAASTASRAALRQNLAHHASRHVGQPKVAAAVAIGELEVVETEQVQDRGVQVVNVDAILNRFEANLVGLAILNAPFDAAAGEPVSEGVR